MSFTNRISLCAASAVLCAASPSSASIVQLTFEGLQDNEQVGGFYNGGAGGFGSIGSQNLGFTFSGNARALIDADQGGTGNFGNEPSPSTVMYFTGGSAITIRHAVIATAIAPGRTTPGVASPPLKPRQRVDSVHSTSASAGHASQGRFLTT